MTGRADGYSSRRQPTTEADPGVALDDEFHAALSIGVPVGIGIYLAWVHRDWLAQSKCVGLAAALAGVWLGFHTTTDKLALSSPASPERSPAPT